MIKQLFFLVTFIFASTSEASQYLKSNINLTFGDDKNFTEDLNKFLYPEYQNRTKFSLMASLTHPCPKWIRLSSTGTLTGSPTKGSVGTYTCIFNVVSGSSGEAGLRMTITIVNKSPMVCKDGASARYYGLTPKGDEELFACKK